MTLKEKQDLALTEVVFEIRRAKELHPGEFHNAHEGYAVLLEEVRELENAVFFGRKEAIKAMGITTTDMLLRPDNVRGMADLLHKEKMREEAIQIAAMAIRFASELTGE